MHFSGFAEDRKCLRASPIDPDIGELGVVVLTKNIGHKPINRDFPVLGMAPFEAAD